jgi:hypothetical protein
MSEDIEAAVREAHGAGDLERAVQVGLSHYRAEVYSFLCARLHSEADAHDVFAQTSEDVWRGITAFRWQCSFRTWLYILARHAAQLLQIHYPPRRWVLKAPAHSPFIDGFVRAFPDAKLICTHRDPISAVGSVASLITAIRSISYRTVDPQKIGEEVLDMVDHVNERFMRARSSLSAAYFCDVHYERLTRDPISVLHDIYAHLGLAFDADMQARAKQWVAAETAEKSGLHRYDLGDFGLDEQIVRRRLRDYIDASRTWM